MELKALVKWMIPVFLLVGTVYGPSIPNTCPKYAKQYCRCDVKEQAKTLKMCSFGNEKDVFCKPCLDSAPDYYNCTECPEIECPVCSAEEFKSESLQRTERKAIEETSDHDRSKRFPFSIRRRLGGRKWCDVKNEIKDGKFTCKAFKNKKQCELKCSEGDYYSKGRKLIYRCYRKKNIWKLYTVPCDNDGKGRPSRPQGSFISREHVRDWPMRTIVRHGNARRFLPMRRIRVHKGYGRRPFMDKRSVGNQTSMSSTLTDVLHSEEKAGSATRIPPEYLLVYGDIFVESHRKELSEESTLIPQEYMVKRSLENQNSVPSTLTDDLHTDEKAISVIRIPPEFLIEYGDLDLHSYYKEPSNESTVIPDEYELEYGDFDAEHGYKVLSEESTMKFTQHN